MNFLFTWSLLVTVLVLSSKAQLLVQPEQVHLSYTHDPTEMVITWVTQDSVEPSVVEYGVDSLNMKATGPHAVNFTDGGKLKRHMFIHHVKLTGLVPGKSYIYHVGSPAIGWSDMYHLKAMHQGSDWAPVLAVFGDMGNKNAKAMPYLQEEAQKRTIDAILHVGDFAYDMDTDNALVGDAFMNQIESVAAYVPYMTCVGNHEHAYNFSNYKFRFSMPGGDGQNLFYSFNMGPAHIIGFSTEVYYYRDSKEYGLLPVLNQYKWLEKDLKEATAPANRSKRPWIITMGHRPMYCSNNDGPKENCHVVDNLVRVGLPGLNQSLETLFYRYGVDLQFYAHEHSYERLWPVYNKKVCNGTSSPYKNPRAPVQIVTGSGGNQEGQTGWYDFKYPWTAFRTDDFGYTRMTIHNKTHLQLDQLSLNKGGKIIDSIMIEQNKHGAFQCL